jgi:putative phosphoesterase
MKVQKVPETNHDPVRIVVLADTHIEHIDELPPELAAELSRSDVIIHLGDFTSGRVLQEFKKAGNFYGISGNHDDIDIKEHEKEIRILEISGKRIGLIHGMIWPFACHKRMKAKFKNYDIDVLLYGHTHMACAATIDDVLIFNPGTLIGEYPARRATFGLLSIDNVITSQIITLDKSLKNYGLRTRAGAFFIRTTLSWIRKWPYFDVIHLLKSVRYTLRKQLWEVKKLLRESSQTR